MLIALEADTHPGSVSILELSHIYSVWWLSLWLVDLLPIAITLFVCSWQLVFTGYYFYYCLSNNQQWPYTKVEGVGSLPLGQSTGREGQLAVSGIIRTCISCIWGMRMPYTCDSVYESIYNYPLIAGKWLNSTIFHNNIKCITTNGQTMIYVSANCICLMTIIYFVQKFWEVLSHL